MRSILLGCCSVVLLTAGIRANAAAGGAQPQILAPLAPGTTLPVTLTKGIDRHHVKTGQTVMVRLYQRVPLRGGGYLSQKAQLVGSVRSYDADTLTIQFAQVKLGRQTEPVDVKLIAAASWMDVLHTLEPLSGPDRATSDAADWTTMQIGRDEVYRSAGSGTVYDQYSEPVGHADLQGVYAAPTSSGLVRAMGPFSTTSAGLYDLPGIKIQHPGGAGKAIVLELAGPKWRLHSDTALLLEVCGH